MSIVSRKKKHAAVIRDECVSCGACAKACPRSAIKVERGLFAVVDEARCVGCGICARECPASVISMREANE